MKLIPLLTAILAILYGGIGDDVIPQLTELPKLNQSVLDALEKIPTVGPTVLLNLKTAWAKLNVLRNDTNEQIEKIYSALKSVKEGSVIVEDLSRFTEAMKVTNISDPLAIPNLAMAGFKVVEELIKDIKEADLKIDGIDQFRKTLSSFQHELGLVRCPVAIFRCLAATLASLLNLPKKE